MRQFLHVGLVLAAGALLMSWGQAETPPPPAPDPNLAIDTVSASVGASRGAFRVTETGAATYSLPIMTAPSGGGMAPDISLDYNSQSGGGLAGPGWNLSGLSAISRCAQTREAGDPRPLGVDLTATNRFCLDGQRLIVSNGLAYGADGAEYRTEVDQILRVRSHGSVGGGPAWFKVWRKDGTIAWYGAGDDAGANHSSRVSSKVGAAPVFAWNLGRIADSAGNFMVFNWQDWHPGDTNVQTTLSSIQYGGHDSGLATNHQILLTYADRPVVEQSTGYSAGAKFKSTKRLTQIHSLAAGVELRRYNLTYRASTADSADSGLLASIQECNGILCLPATTLDWNTATLALAATGTSPTAEFQLGSNVVHPQPADINGDGLIDLIFIEKQSSSTAPIIKWRLSVQQSSGYPVFGALVNGPSMHAGVKSNGEIPQLHLIDINGNGFNDVLYAVPNSTGGGGNFYAHLRSGTTFGSALLVGSYTGSARRLQPMDWNGDGRTDLVYQFGGGDWGSPSLWIAEHKGFNPSNPSGTFVQQSGSTPFLKSQHSPLNTGYLHEPLQFSIHLDRVADTNGDGLADLVIEVRHRYCVWDCPLIQSVPGDDELDGEAGSDGEADPEPGIGTGEEGNDGQIEFGNAVYETRGFMVLFEMVWDAANNRFRLESRTVLGGTPDDQTGTSPRMTELRLVDVNGDGLADLVYYDLQANQWRFRINTGKGNFLAATQITTWPTDVGLRKYIQLVDISGNGHPDALIPTSHNSTTAMWQISKWNRSLNSGEGGFGTLVATSALAGKFTDGAQSIFADFNGNGRTDQLLLRPSSGNLNVTRFWGVNSSSFSPAYDGHFMLRRITDGLGAWTQLSYKSLVQRSIHTRDRNAPYIGYGLGSAVYDIVPPIYVVSAATSLAPQYTLNATATGSTYAATGTAQVDYYYAGAKIQAGGRGFLGFREVASWDPQSGLLTRTRYHQDFPFISLPEETHSWYKASAPWTATDTVAPLVPCATPPCANTAIATNGVLLGRALNTWSERATVAGLTLPYLARSEEWSYTPSYTSGSLTGSVFTHRVVTENSNLDVYGNLGQVSTATYTSTSGTGSLVARQTAVNTYTNTASTWRLGRLTCVVSTSERPGQTTQTRRSSFGYDATTGILIRETVQPTDCGTTGAAINTVHTLDQFGNQLETTVTASDLAGSRRSLNVYDTRGRYVDQQRVFIGGAWRTVSQVISRDAYGNPTEVRNAQGVSALQKYDAMGRLQTTRSPDGAWSRVLHRLGTVSQCPTGTVFREEHTGLATGTTYIDAYVCKDVLGREIRTASRAFEGGWIYRDIRYDAVSQPIEASAPYRAGQTAHWTRTVYDEIGRVEAVRVADPANGNPLETWTYSGLSTTHVNALGQSTTVVNNPLGEKVSETAPDGGITTHGYDALGNLLFSDGPLTGTGDRITIAYDALGRKSQMSDPDKGIWQYHYNGLGELICQRDAKSQGTLFAYDELGRQTSRTDLTGVTNVTTCAGTQRGATTWTYGIAQLLPTSGRLLTESSQYADGVGADHTTSRSFSYDSLGRDSQVSTTITDGTFSRTYVESTTYDEFGRVFQSFDASGNSRGIRYLYNARGYVSQLRESRGGTTGQVYWTIQAMDAHGNVTQGLMGNSTQVAASYDQATGAVLHLQDATGTTLAQDLILKWDALGNLTERRDWSGNRDQEERFWYDARNRLTRTDSRTNGGTWTNSRQVQTYNVAGNILTKTGLGTYTYGSTRPHAVTSSGGVTYTYDANGNVISDTSGRAFHYTSFDLIRRVSQGTAHTEFHYAAGRGRSLKRELSGTTVQSRTHYLGNVEVIWNGSSPGTGVGQYRRYIGGMLIATWYQSTGVDQLRYLHTDHLGSTTAITDEAGQVVTWMSYDPWGLRRHADAWHPWTAPPSVYLNAMLAVTPRGFTGHEHVDNAGIIHMNGRIYDPRLGRFLQADPFIEDASTLNRYTYVHNNPLAYTDPSGFFSWKKVLKIAAMVAISVVTYGAASAYFGTLMTSQILVNAAAGAVTGFVTGGLATGTLEGAFMGALGGAVMGAAAGVNWGNSIARTLGTATAGGVQSSLSGGKFGHGFVSAGITSAASPALNRVPHGGRTIANAVVGGTASRLSGGKFANGAVTAAMSYAFSASFSDARPTSDTDTDNIFSSSFEGRPERSIGSRIFHGALDVVGKVWALPNTIVGTVVGLAGVPFGAKPRFTNNAIWFENYPWGEGAITLGNVVLSTHGWGPGNTRIAYGVLQNIGLHEQAHTLQYQALGPFFGPAYLVSGGAFSTNSLFERSATRYATTGKGWWPWSR